MLSNDVEIIDIAPDQYERVIKLIDPSRFAHGTGLILFYSGSRLFHAVHTRKGPDIPVDFHGPQRLETLATKHNVDWILCLERNALKRLAATAQSGMALADPLTARGQATLRALGSELGAGIHVWPDPAPLIARLQTGFSPLLKKLIPPNMRLLAGVFDDDGGLWASAIVELHNKDISFVSTSDLLEPLDFSGKSLSDKTGLMLAQCTKKRGPAQLGVFCDRSVLMHIARHPRPGTALARFVRLGWVTLGPCPWRIRLALRFLPLFLRANSNRQP